MGGDAVIWQTPENDIYHRIYEARKRESGAMNPQIITYRSDDAPERIRWCAYFLPAGKKEPLPMVFRAGTKELAIASAESFWAGEVAKEKKKEEHAAAMRERLARR
jgi:hypothetical protein